MIKRLVSAFAVFGLLISLCGCFKTLPDIRDGVCIQPDLGSAFELQCQYNDIIYDFFVDFTDDGILHLKAKGSLPPALENTSLVIDGNTVTVTSCNVEAVLSLGRLPADFIPGLIYEFISYLSSADTSQLFEKTDGRYFCSRAFGEKTFIFSFPCDLSDKSVYLLEIC